MKIFYILFLSAFAFAASARTLEVGPFRQYQTLQTAAAAAQPGDTILLREAIHSGNESISNLQGNADNWITIRVATGEEVIYRGGSNALHMTDAAYLRFEGIIFEQQTGNGVNMDDGGTYDTPAHHIIFENCEWRSMNATGNNDELKLSGVDQFAVRNCRFTNGATGGSMIDMVGCHFGVFEGNHFENGGSNAIQAKGATKDIVIQGNTFRNAGQRAINIGGSTGLEFFRPLNANYEASNIYVYSNIFMGSQAPIAYVGAVNCEVVNNTIVRPDRWAIRILQETTEPNFLPCGNNSFINNIVVFNTAQPAINIGGNTAPETFTFSHNLWYNPDNASWGGPNTPVGEPGRILNVDPQFADTLFNLLPTSPAIGKGLSRLTPERDFLGRLFPVQRSIGASEVGGASVRMSKKATVMIFPNPVANFLTIDLSDASAEVVITDIRGTLHWSSTVDGSATVDAREWPSGAYLVRIGTESYLIVKE